MTNRLERGRLRGRPRFAVLAGVLLATATIAAGCGGDGDDTDTTVSPERADFIAKADKLCTEAGDEMNAAVEKRLGKGVVPDDAVIEVYKDITIPGLQDLFDQIGELTPPPGEEEQVQEILDAADDALDAARDNPADLARLPGDDNPFDSVNELEQAYGFKVCGAVQAVDNGD